MITSVATATYYFLPFEQTLEIIAGAGFQTIELDLYWNKGPWGMAAHLKDYRPREIARRVEACGLRVATIHDGGGMLDARQYGGYLHPDLRETVEALGYAPGAVIFHPPCRAGAENQRWWQARAPKIARQIKAFAGPDTLVAMENLTPQEGYYVPICTPRELLDFVARYEVGANLDVTHCAQIGVDFLQAARALGPHLAALHLSDFANGRPHVFLGDGGLNFPAFFRQVDLSGVRFLTLECSAARLGEDPRQLSQADFTARLAEAKRRLEGLVQGLF